MQTNSVEAEVMEAYCDSHPGITFEESIPRRNLDFKASLALTRDEAVSLMKKAAPEGYNNFHADLLKLLPIDSMVIIARQHSVCIYVTPPIEEPIDKMLADEWHTEDGGTRIWWG